MNHYEILGMTCSACSAHVERAVGKLSFVEKAQVSLLTHSMTVETKDGLPHREEVEAAVAAAGYQANALDGAEKGKAITRPVSQQSVDGALKSRFFLSLVLMLPLMYVSMQHMLGYPIFWLLDPQRFPLVNALAQLCLATPVLYVNRSYFIGGFKRMVALHPNMDTLIAIGSGASYLYGLYMVFQMAVGYGKGDMALVHHAAMQLYFESAVMILTLITLGKYFEARAKKKTTSAIEKLMELTPDEVTLLQDGEERRIATGEVHVGDVLVIRPGERVPVDGVLLEGQVSLDQSHITGESLPVDKAAGEPLVAGSISSSAAFQMRATQVGEETTLAKIVRLVQEAGDSKAPISKLADKVSGIFVPVVIGIALCTLAGWLLAGYGFSFALSCAISVLVISCPCALGLATPVAIMVGTGVGAQHGILFRNGEVLETLHHIRSIVLDKTGTLTEGRMTVQLVEGVGNTQHKELLALAATLEHGSNHPLAMAVRAYCQEQGVQPGEMSDFQEVAGRGLQATMEGERILAGSPAWMRDNDISISIMEAAIASAQGKGYSILCFARGGKLLGVIGVADSLKPSSARAVAELKALHITPYLLTGDQKLAAEYMARKAGIEQVMAEVMPGDKAAKVQQLQQEGQRVAMVGDGINDAPALKQADVGIAVGAGTDIAIETADVVLASNRLSDVPTAVRLSRAVLRNIKQNLFWAFFYNVIGIPIAAGALYPALGLTLSPMLGAAAMSLSSVCVVSNALRLKRFRVREGQDEGNGMEAEAGLALQAEEASPLEALPKSEKGKPSKEEHFMERTVWIEGMSCNHCKMAAEKALSALPGVESAQVDLEKKRALVKGTAEDQDIRTAIADAGFTVTGIEE